jgi:hypothetical protein
VVERLMCKAPEDRYPSIADAVKELQAVSSCTRPLSAPGKAAGKKTVTAVAPTRALERGAAGGVTRSEGDRTPGPQPSGWLLPALSAAGLAAGLALGLLSWWLTRR